PWPSEAMPPDIRAWVESGPPGIKEPGVREGPYGKVRLEELRVRSRNTSSTRLVSIQIPTRGLRTMALMAWDVPSRTREALSRSMGGYRLPRNPQPPR